MSRDTPSRRDKMLRFLRSLGLCAAGTRKYKGLTPVQAWKKALANGQAANLPARFHASSYHLCWCCKENPKIPAGVLAAYRRFK